MATLTIRAPAPLVLFNPASPKLPTSSGNRAEAKALSKFFTRPDLAARYYRVFCRFFDPKCFQFIEPGAGSGAFLHVLPVSTFGFDIAPTGPGIFRADFLKLGIYCSVPTACIGNPPFGKNANLAVAFFNHAATFSDVIAFILPRTFRKTMVINKLHSKFHLLHEELVPDNAFVFEGEVRSVPTVFQIWERRESDRAKLPVIRSHPDFKILPAEEAKKADFALQRVGKNAGLVHHDLDRSHKAHYFIKGNVEHVMKELRAEFAKAAANTAGKPSLALTELVSIYTAHLVSQSGSLS